jgi:acyl carrier protein
MTTPAAVKRRMAAFLKLPEERLADDALLASLVHESFVLIQLVMDLQEEFGARLVQDDLRDVQTVAQLVAQVVAHTPASS